MLMQMPHFVGSKGVFSGNVIGVCLQLSVCSVGHHKAVCRTGLLNGVIQKDFKSCGFGGRWTALSGSSVFPFQLWHRCNHLNRVHLEIALQSVCCVNPSLDVYFNSVYSVLSIILSAKL